MDVRYFFFNEGENELYWDYLGMYTCTRGLSRVGDERESINSLIDVS